MGAAGKGFGQRVKQARMDLSAKLGRVVTQTEVAARLKVTGTTVGRWESGEKEPSLTMIGRLAKVLGVSPALLAFGDTPPTPHGPQKAPPRPYAAEEEAS
jgi:transcriptional regulator with XRE-family HTH domain